MVRIYHSLFIYGSVEGHWGWFQFLANTIKLLWIFVCKFLKEYVFEGVYPLTGLPW